jgi:hypothetical protein
MLSTGTYYLRYFVYRKGPSVAADTDPGEPIGSPLLADMVRRLTAPDYERWRAQVRATNGCSRPVHLVGESHTVDAATGELIHVLRTAEEPGGPPARRVREPAGVPLCSVR